MQGWMGCILRIDLAERSFREEKLDREIVRDYLGGRGLAARLLLDSLSLRDKGSPIILTIGPLTGTGINNTPLNLAISP